MIKKLRRRFIAVNMSILTSVLLGVLIGIYAFMYSSEVNISYELMESILNERDMGTSKPDDVPESAENTIEKEIKTASNLSFQMNFGQRHEFPDNIEDERGVEFRPDPFDPGSHEPPPDMPQPTMPQENEPDRPDMPVDQPTEPAANPTEPQKNDENSQAQPTDPKSGSENSVRKDGGSAEPYKPATPPQTESEKHTTTVTSQKPQKDTSTTAVTSVTTLPEKPDGQKPPFEKDFSDPYKGKVKRAHIIVQFNDNNDIDRVVYQYFEGIDEDEIKAAAKEVIGEKNDRGKITVGSMKLRYMRSHNPRTSSGGGRILFLDRTTELSTVNRLVFIFIIIGCVGIVVIFAISVLLANWMVKPVDKAWKQQKQFVADASHELKTPLTVISSNTDVILSNSDDTVKSQSKWLNYIKDETARMTKLVNSMLYIAKYDSNEIKFTPAKLDISKIMSSICLQYEALFFEKGKLLETDIEENIIISGDEDKIKQLINILLDNAGKYSSENGKIKAELSRVQKTGKITLIVSNTSDYIASDKLERIFDRFYRLDDSRNRKTGGSGLGLNIAKSITDAHGGSIKAIHENGITSFIVEI
ncbi:MAG: ATP-binding protein [Clostridium sp.]|nr:ATP-binding protein [Clostridium sp.]MCM1547411.1 ATP-binding protein [Ruminococcus sp.]